MTVAQKILDLWNAGLKQNQTIDNGYDFVHSINQLFDYVIIERYGDYDDEGYREGFHQVFEYTLDKSRIRVDQFDDNFEITDCTNNHQDLSEAQLGFLVVRDKHGMHIWNAYPATKPTKLGFYFVRDNQGAMCVAEWVREDDICADSVIHWWDTRYYWKCEIDGFCVEHYREIPGDKYQEDNMLRVKQFLAEASKTSAFGTEEQREQFKKELLTVLKDHDVVKHYELEYLVDDRTKDIITALITYDGIEDWVQVRGEIVFKSPTECVVTIREYSGTGDLRDYYHQYGDDAKDPKEILGKLGAEYVLDEPDPKVGYRGRYTIFADVSKLQNRTVRIVDLKQFAKLCKLLADMRDEAIMYEYDGHGAEMFHKIDLSKLEHWINHHKQLVSE